MKPPPFEYHAPATIEEALELLADENGTHALAGGQSLVQLMKFRRVRPTALVDLNGVSELDGLEEREGELHVGALVRQQRLLEDQLVARSWPLLAEAARFVGYKETRRRGTVGGSLAFAAPWAELTAAAVALDAAIDVRSLRGARSIPARTFFRGPNTTALEPGELIVRVRFPAPAARSGASFHEVSARYRDYAQVAAAAIVSADGLHGAARPALRRGDAVPARRLRRARGRERARGPARVDRAGRRHRGLRHLQAPRRRRPRAPRAARGRPACPSRGERMTATLPLRIEVNGRWYERQVEPRRTLADFLREDLDLTGTHLACEHGFCGSCNVLLDGDSVRSCLMFAVQAQGRSLQTVEGLAEPDGTLSELQQAFTEHHALQCGFCTPGDAADRARVPARAPR